MYSTSQFHRRTGGQEEEEMKLFNDIVSPIMGWYMFNGVEHTAILSHFLTFITGSSSRLLRIRFSADLTMYWFPVHENLSIGDMDLESKYCYFYHSWDFVPYYIVLTSYCKTHVSKVNKTNTYKVLM